MLDSQLITQIFSKVSLDFGRYIVYNGSRKETIMTEYELRELAQIRVSNCDDTDTLMDWAVEYWLLEYQANPNIVKEHIDEFLGL